jgi:pimeloyl-ACP methyl ester carboxylesterase
VADIYKSPAGKQIVEGVYRAALKRWPVPCRQLTLPTREGETFVIVSGEHHATPMVLFHGSGTNTAVWMRDVAVWSRHYRVYAVDMIGEPGLSAPSRPLLTSDRYVSWLDDVWHQLGLDMASVVGVSLGGWLALDYAVRRPQRVLAVSLIAPSGIGRQNPYFAIKAALLLVLGQWGRRQARSLVAGATRIPPEAARYFETIFQHFRPRLERIPIRTDAELAALSMPVQVIIGGKDVMLRSSETRDRMARLVRHLRLSYLENDGHILPSQTETILEFVNEVTRGHRRQSA